MSTIYLTNDHELSQIADAIREKGGTTEQLVYPDGFISAINNIPTGGGGGSVDSGVVFIDYDGSIVDSWESSLVASKTALPANSTHEGLVAEGWNWSLANIQSYILKYPNAKVIVGQMYHTVSGLTEMDITVTKVTGLAVTCNMVGNKNWGDGTEDSLTTHTYTDYGDYTITCDGTSIPTGTSASGGLFSSTTSNQNRYWCTAIRIGEDVTLIGHSAFRNCRITSVTIPDSVTSIGNYAFHSCYSLTSVTIPDSVTSIGSSDGFRDCRSLTSVTIPDSVTSIGNGAFRGCMSLTSVTIPDSVTSIGNHAFHSCYSLTSVTIPDSVTSIDYFAFQICYSLTSVTISDGVTFIGNGVFQTCYSLTSVIIPDSVTSIGNGVFADCSSLTSVSISNSVTSIDEATFSGCTSLTSVTIPDSVTFIGNGVFQTCYSITEYDFITSTIVPTLSNTNAFHNINGICKIIVPDALYDNWIVATNWVTYADYIYKASEVA